MTILANRGLSFFKARTNSLIPLNASSHLPKKSVKKNSDIYKLTVEENLLVQHSKVSAMKEVLSLVM